MSSTTLCLISVIAAYFYGIDTANKTKTNKLPEISSESILDRIQDQQFLVTKTVFLNEEITITVEKDSDWDNLLWGETIEAEGIARLDIGVDLKKLNSQDISIDTSNQTISIKLPDPEILDTSLYDDLEIKTQKGIIKNIQEIFDKKEGDDYNKAVQALIDLAKQDVLKDQKILEEAKEDSTRGITILLNDLDYKIEYL